jgi:hypothetical protein
VFQCLLRYDISSGEGAFTLPHTLENIHLAYCTGTQEKGEFSQYIFFILLDWIVLTRFHRENSKFLVAITCLLCVQRNKNKLLSIAISNDSVLFLCNLSYQQITAVAREIVNVQAPQVRCTIQQV